jgi:hypothetical protein
MAHNNCGHRPTGGPLTDLSTGNSNKGLRRDDASQIPGMLFPFSFIFYYGNLCNGDMMMRDDDDNDNGY